MSKRCISNITEKSKEEQDQQTAISTKDIQEMILEYNIPNEIAKELAIFFLKDKIVD